MPSHASLARVGALLGASALLHACVFVPDGKYVVTGPELAEILEEEPEERYGEVRVREGIAGAIGDTKDFSRGDPKAWVALPLIVGTLVALGATTALVSQGVHFDGYAEVGPDTLMHVGGHTLAVRELHPEMARGSHVTLADGYALGDRLALVRDGLSLGFAGGLSLLPVEDRGLLPAGDFRTDLAIYLHERAALLAAFRVASGITRGSRAHELFGGLGVRGWLLSVGRFHLGVEGLVGVGATMFDGQGAPAGTTGMRAMVGPVVELELTTNLALSLSVQSMFELTPAPRFGGVVFEAGLVTYF